MLSALVLPHTSPDYPLLSQLPLPILVLDGAVYSIALANDAVLHIWNKERSAVLGKSFFDVFPEAALLLKEGFDRVLQTGEAFVLPEVVLHEINSNLPVGVVHRVVHYPMRNSAGNVTGIIALGQDISAEVQSRDRVKHTQERLLNALDSAEVGTWSFDLVENKVYASQQLKKHFDYPQNEEFTYERFISLVVEKDRDYVDKVNQEMIAMKDGKSQYDLDYQINATTAGLPRWLKAKGRVYADAAGTPVMFSGTVQDITLQRQLLQNLSYRTALLEAQSEAIPDAILVVDTKGKMLSYNKHFAHIWRIPQAIVDAKDDDAALRFAMTQVADPQAFIDRVNYLYQNTKEASREEVLFLDGRIIERYGNAVAGADGNVYGWAWFFRDITESKKASEAIARSEENFRQLADLMPQIVWTARPDGFVDYYNEQWYRFTGFKRGYGDQSWLPILHPDEVQTVTDVFYAAIRTGEPYQIELRFKDGDSGAFRWFLSKAVPVRNKEGFITKWFGTSTDIHDQKTLTQQLEALVKERTWELERSNADLQQFAHVASHDLKEPVRKIRTFGSRLKEEFSATLPERAQMYINKIESSAERMYHMIDGVLLYSSINSMDEGRTQVDLNDLLQEVQMDLELLMQQKSAVVHAGALPQVYGSKILLSQLFYNLLNNALKFTHPHRSVQVWVSGERKGDKVLIQFRDNGIGFNSEQADTIFKTFARLHSKDQYEGTGLGLALCQRIVERHNGRIWAEGEEDVGANFFVELPVDQN